MKPFDIESIILGTILKYGDQAARLALPDLTPDKFIFRFDGEFGTEHSYIWQAISDTFLIKRLQPTLINVLASAGQYSTELTALIDRLDYQYRMNGFDPKQFMSLTDLVDKYGIIYKAAQQGHKLATNAEDVETLLQTASSITDIDVWLTEQLTALRQIMSRRSVGYTHIGTIGKDVQQEWNDLYTGKKSALLQTGFPTLYKHKLFPKGKLTVIHGMPGSGKSSFVFQMCLGVAIDLYQRNEPGVVAINSLEMEQNDLVEKMAGILAGVDATKLINQSMTQNEFDRLMLWEGYVERLPIFIDNTPFITTTAMEYRASGLHVSEHGPVVLLATDYGELFGDDDPSNEQRVATIFRNQFQLARLINASVIAISQSTIDRSVTGRSYIAGPDGTRYSKAIHQATDVQCEMYNPPAILASGRQDLVVPPGMSTEHAYLLVQKYRKGATNFSVELGWQPECTRFYDYDLNSAAIPGKETLFSHFIDPFNVPQIIQTGSW